MIRYAKHDRICRSRQLLSYFGDYNGHNCGQCDVCLSQRSTGAVSEQKYHDAIEAILNLLSDNKPHYVTEIKSIELPESELDAAISYLTNEEYISQTDDERLEINL
jgi:ATP-dependent DNA helicase RecQ